MLFPKETREERAIVNLLVYLNSVLGSSYEIREWLDRGAQTGQNQLKPTPDCLCEDRISGNSIVIERTMLANTKDMERGQLSARFLSEVKERLRGNLQGIFRLYDWDIETISYNANNRTDQIEQLSQAILNAASTLGNGVAVKLNHPFPVKLMKLESHGISEESELLCTYPASEPSLQGQRLQQQFKKVLEEANRKFERYTSMPTFLLVNIFETQLDYQEFNMDVAECIDMEQYPNIMNIYLSEGAPDPIVQCFWANEAQNKERCFPTTPCNGLLRRLVFKIWVRLKRVKYR